MFKFVSLSFLLTVNQIDYIDSFLCPKNNKVFERSSSFSSTSFLHENVYDNEETRIGVLLCNLGGPETKDDVESFLYNLFSDADIIRLPKIVSFIQKPLARVLSKRRAPYSKAAYESIGGGSPILDWTKAQANALEKKLDERGLDRIKCFIAMRYWNPFTNEALKSIKKENINKLVILPLYPQYSISTTGSSLRELQKEFGSDSYFIEKMTHSVLPNWHDRQGYIESISNMCVKEILALPTEQTDKKIVLLFSAHGVPKSYIKEGDPYQKQIEECTELIKNEIRSRMPDKNLQFEVSYQSKVGPVEWLQPSTDTKIEEIGKKGIKNLVVVPISFVSEHIETLEEIDIEYREKANNVGIENWRRVPALNTDSFFIEDLASMVFDTLQAPALSIDRVMASQTNKEKTESKVGNCVQEKNRKGGNSIFGDMGGALLLPQTCLTVQKIAYASFLMATLDGCGREILLNSQLPVVNTFIF